MSDPTYDAWREWRERLLRDLPDIRAAYLRMLVGELRQLTDVCMGELARRDQPTERQDARLFKPKGPPQ